MGKAPLEDMNELNNGSVDAHEIARHAFPRLYAKTDDAHHESAPQRPLSKVSHIASTTAHHGHGAFLQAVGRHTLHLFRGSKHSEDGGHGPRMGRVASNISDFSTGNVEQLEFQSVLSGAT